MKFFKSSLPQNVLSPLLITLFQMIHAYTKVKYGDICTELKIA